MLLMGCLSVAAQEPAAKTVYVFQPHWYGQLQVGGQYTLGEIGFSDLLSPNAQIGVGYNFSPVFGARLNVNAWQSKAGMESKYDNYTAKWKWNYVAPAVDLTVNLSNALCGFNPKRVFNLGIFAGIGANIAFGNDDAKTEKEKVYGAAANWMLDQDHYNQNMDYVWDGSKVRFMAQGGVTADFRVSEKVSIGLEVSANGVNDHYNSKRSHNIDWYFNALAGVKVNLGKSYYSRRVEGPKPQIVEKVVEKIVEKPVYIEKNVSNAEPEVRTNAMVEKMRREIFFGVSVTSIKKDDEKKIQEIADFLKRNPNAKVVVEGYASKDGGRTPAAVNKRLAGKRASTVVNVLKTKHGIPASRITMVNKADTEQPFPTNDQNRVCILVAE